MTAVSAALPVGVAFGLVAAYGPFRRSARAGTPSRPVGVAFGLVAAYGPVAAVRGRARRRERQRAEPWPDVVDDLASGNRAGMSLPDALSRVGEHGPHAMREAFVAFGLGAPDTGRFGTMTGAQGVATEPAP